MKSDGKIERFDELQSAWLNRQMNNDPSNYCRALGHVDADQFADLVDECLIYYQGYHIAHDSDPWIVYLPYAWELARGMKIYNDTSGDVYTVDGIYTDKNGDKTGYVLLTGHTPPKDTDRLVIEKSYRIRFMHGYPKSMQEYFLVDDSDTLGQHSGAWFDTITWIVTRQEPGSVSGAPFTGKRQRKPLDREDYIDPEDEGYARLIRAQPLDTLITFDFWAQTQRQATRLIRWFQEFMTLNRWVFKINGLIEMMFWERRPDNASAAFRKNIVHRTVTWYVRVEEQLYSVQRRLNDLKIEAEINGPDSTGTIGQLDPTGVIPVEVIEQ